MCWRWSGVGDGDSVCVGGGRGLGDGDSVCVGGGRGLGDGDSVCVGGGRGLEDGDSVCVGGGRGLGDGDSVCVGGGKVFGDGGVSLWQGVGVGGKVEGVLRAALSGGNSDGTPRTMTGSWEVVLGRWG